MTSPPDNSLPIQRDFRYHKTRFCDHVRQHFRRAAKQVSTVLEIAWVAPTRWGGKTTDKTLSTAILTMNSRHRLEPLLRYIRGFSDEVVIGVDSKTTDDTWDCCEQWQREGLIDVLFRLENPAATCNGGLEALVEHCTSDWIFRLDDDEYPEPRFAELKAGLLETGHYTHYKLPRLHICQTQPLLWINDGYLYPDYQMRLFKNDPALLSYPGAVGHTSIGCSGKRGRINSVNLIHLNLAINPLPKRKEKLRRYVERLNGGWVHPINESALLFEQFNYRKERYRYPDPDFLALLTQVTEDQRKA